jgi:hypothetical protein
MVMMNSRGESGESDKYETKTPGDEPMINIKLSDFLEILRTLGDLEVSISEIANLRVRLSVIARAQKGLK